MTPRRIGHHRPTGMVAERARRGERGSVLMMVAISLSVIVTCTALTIDLGRVSTLRRDLQNVADAAALDLVRLVDGRTAGEITTDPLWASTRAASLARNGFELDAEAIVSVRLGAYDADGEVFTPVIAADQIPSAVQVVVTDRVEHQFAPGGTSTSRTAVGAQSAAAGIQLGSFAARLDSAESALLGPLLDDALGVTIVGYEGLAGVRIGVEALATELALTVASPDELLTTELTVLELIEAQIRVLQDDGRLAEAQLLGTLALGLEDPDATITLGDLMSIGTGGADAAAVATLDVLELLTATAWAVQPDSSFLQIPALDLGVPGVVSSTTGVTIVESPQIAFGGPGTSVDTAQVELSTTIALDVPGLSDVVLTLDLTAASATATIRDMTCGSPSRLDVEVATGLASADAGLAADVRLTLPSPLDGSGEIPVAHATVEGSAARPPASSLVPFDLPPDEIGVAKQVSTDSITITDMAWTSGWELLPSVPPLGALLTPTVDGMVDAAVAALVEPIFPQVVAALDVVLVQPLLSLLGITLPGADVTPLALRCTGASLVA